MGGTLWMYPPPWSGYINKRYFMPPSLQWHSSFEISITCTTLLTLIMGWTCTSGFSVLSEKSIWYRVGGRDIIWDKIFFLFLKVMKKIRGRWSVNECVKTLPLSRTLLPKISPSTCISNVVDRPSMHTMIDSNPKWARERTSPYSVTRIYLFVLLKLDPISSFF